MSDDKRAERPAPPAARKPGKEALGEADSDGGQTQEGRTERREEPQVKLGQMRSYWSLKQRGTLDPKF